jgi:Peptide methionine sulfoxide reductase
VPRASPFFRPALIFAVLLLAAGITLRGLSSAAESAHSIPPPALDEPASSQMASEVAILAGGCFWGVQGVFQHVEGVSSAVSGYAGGAADAAHYEMVGTNTTGHAESVRVIFDPRRISYGRILQIYFSVAHDPTELNRQGRMSARSIVLQSFRPIPSRHVLRRPTSPNSTRRMTSMRRLCENKITVTRASMREGRHAWLQLRVAGLPRHRDPVLS